MYSSLLNLLGQLENTMSYQCCPDEESTHAITTISVIMAHYQRRSLVFGMCSAQAILKRELSNMVRHLDRDLQTREIMSMAIYEYDTL